jgi:hypothetical protein
VSGVCCKCFFFFFFFFLIYFSPIKFCLPAITFVGFFFIIIICRIANLFVTCLPKHRSRRYVFPVLRRSHKSD